MQKKSQRGAKLKAKQAGSEPVNKKRQQAAPLPPKKNEKKRKREEVKEEKQLPPETKEENEKLQNEEVQTEQAGEENNLNPEEILLEDTGENAEEDQPPKRQRISPILERKRKKKEKKQKPLEELIMLDSSEKEVTPSTEEQKEKKGVIYIGHIPHGFYEEQMRGYFSQFGTVTAIHLSRNKKTGKSKHYAFVEFDSDETAQVVAEAMNGYFLFGKTLEVHVVPPEKVHPDTFKHADRGFIIKPYRKIARQQANKPKTPEQRATQLNRLVKKETKFRQKLKDLGIEYEFPGYTAMKKSKPQHTYFKEQEED